MFLDFLNEDAGITPAYDVEPIFEEYCDGSVESLDLILSEDVENIYDANIGLCQLDQLALVNEAKIFSKDTFKNLFDKIIKAVKEAWAKVKGFFERLFKSIQISVGNINKALSNIDKFTDKDYSEFEYQGYDWKKSPNSYSALAGNCNKVIKAIKSKMGENTDKTFRMSEEQQVGTVFYGSPNKETPLKQVKNDVYKSYRSSETKVTIKNFNKGESLDAMIKFLKDFDKNETLINARKNANAEFSDLLDLCEEAKSKSDKALSDAAKKGTNDKTISQNNAARCQTARSIVAKYNQIMSLYIGLEKSKFSDYKSIVSKAVRYNPKKSK